MTRWYYDLSKGILWCFFRAGFGLTVRGQEHVPRSGPCIVACNHVSYFDPPVMGAACPRRLVFMARENLFHQPLLASFMRGVGVIPLQRDTGDLGAIRQAIARLRQGEAIAMFPEGGRQYSGVLGRAKRGVGLLAVTAKAPIVPAYIRGTFQAWPPTERRLHRAKIQVAFAPPIPYTKRPVQEAGVHSAPRQHEWLADAVTAAWRRLAEGHPA